ncbi:glutamyl-tRNA reductase [Marinicella sp. W31]|uniref:glutamyl-tRNA reductase n=1 Tax=Marinicella sp. W31 TaxID=3023713 RepID=UPI003757FC90
MALVLFGINHNSAPLDVREKYAFSESDYAQNLAQLLEYEEIQCAVALSTCNRTEFYLSLEQGAEHEQVFQKVFSANMDVPHFYQSLDFDCARHLFRVAAGTDSVVVGETQIQGQVKKAYEIAQSVKPLNAELEKLFQMTFKTAKSVRSATEIGKNPISVAHCAVQLSEQIFGQLQFQNILVIGAGETSELVIRYLLNHDGGSITVSNRTASKAKHLAEHFNIKSIEMNRLGHDLSEFDLVFSATSSAQPIITFEMTEHALKTRKMKPMVMIDLAVPRDIDADIHALEDVFLYTVDDLKSVIVDNMNKRKSTLEEADRIIDAEVSLFMQWLQRLQYHALLKEFRESFISKKEEIVDAYRTGDDTMDAKLEQLAHQLTNRMLHTPISKMREILETGSREEIRLVAELFDLKTHQ